MQRVSDYGETSEASAAPPGVSLQSDGGEDEDFGDELLFM